MIEFIVEIGDSRASDMLASYCRHFRQTSIGPGVCGTNTLREWLKQQFGQINASLPIVDLWLLAFLQASEGKAHVLSELSS